LIVITGRAKNVVKVAGKSVGLEEIERGLMTIPSVTAVAAAGLPDPHSGEALAVLVVADSGAVDAASVRAAAHQRLGPDFVPKVIYFADAMPLLPNGKLDRYAVARRLSGQTVPLGSGGAADG
jgi:acyl-coenzyme A synthetase/AMP-(fatty) acid ligase